MGYKTTWCSHFLDPSTLIHRFLPLSQCPIIPLVSRCRWKKAQCVYGNVLNNVFLVLVPSSFYNSYPPAPIYGSDPYDPYSANSCPPGSSYASMQQPYMSQPYYSHPLMQQYIRYYDYYREPNVLNRLLNRARYGTGSYFGNPYSHTRVTFDPQGNRIWPEANYVSSVKDLWKTSDPYADS